MTVVAQPKVNGAFETTQVLTAHLTHMVVDAGVNVAVTGYTVTGNVDLGTVTSSVKTAGEELIELISDVTNIVIAENPSANVWHMAVEVNGLSNTDIANVINSSDTFGAATVTFGTYSVTV